MRRSRSESDSEGAARQRRRVAEAPPAAAAAAVPQQDEEHQSEEPEAEQSDSAGSEQPEQEGNESESDDEGEGEEQEWEDPMGGVFPMPGGAGWDIVVGMPEDDVEIAVGAIPEVLPTDTQIAPGVWARRQPDAHHCVIGGPLRYCPKLLRRIFKMQQQPRQLLWRSDLALTEGEWDYIQGVLGADRIQPLLQRGQRVLKPLPAAGFPYRLRLRDRSGGVLNGPRESGPNAKPWNVGRQYFSSYVQGDDSSFIWADGVRVMEPEAQEAFRGWGGLF